MPHYVYNIPTLKLQIKKQSIHKKRKNETMTYVPNTY